MYAIKLLQQSQGFLFADIFISVLRSNLFHILKTDAITIDFIRKQYYSNL